MHSFNNFILEFIFLPSAMLGYACLMAVLIRSTIKDWLKERREKNSAKKSGTDDQAGQ